MKKPNKLFYALSLLLGFGLIAASAVFAASTNPKDGSLFPSGSCKNCSKDGSVFPGGSCKNCSKNGSLIDTGPCKKCKKKSEKVPGYCNKCFKQQTDRIVIPEHLPVNYIAYNSTVYDSMQTNCCMMAPIALDHVDFRIATDNVESPYTSRVGNYRFRIFGCRRFDKEARLNNGRIMEKDIAFHKVFEQSVNNCYKVLPMPQDLCLQQYTQELPEYILTAEITDYYMDICDEYSWDEAKKTDNRSGSSEIKVVWRLMDLTKHNVYWKGETSGFGELMQGESNGEIKLIERAFADASSNLRGSADFEKQLMKRVSPESLMMQRTALIEEERALNPTKCGFSMEYQCARQCEISRPEFTYAPTACGCGCGCQTQPTPVVETGDVISTFDVVQTCVDANGVIRTDGNCTPVVESGDVVSTFDVIETCIDENGNVRTDGNCHVVDDTWIDTGDVKALEEFCIIRTDPCKALTPETMYRLRSSVVQIESPNGRKGAGLLISENFVLTSGDLVDHDRNSYKITTIRNDILGARAVRVNPSKNTALLMLDKSTAYTPLALNLSLPEVGKNGFLTLGVLNVDNFKNGEDYLENSARIEGYRYTPEKGAEILANTFIQNVTVGGALFYKDCTISGMAHSGIKTDDGLDIYVPTETALRSLGISICGHEYVEESPWQQTVYKPVTEQIKQVQKAPEEMKAKERK